MRHQSHQNGRKETVKIVAIYALFGIVWIYGSDTVLGWLIQDRALMIQVSVAKGSLFILCTATLLFFLINRFVLQSAAAEQGRVESLKYYQALFNASNEAIFVHDVRSRRILDVNDRMLEIFGYNRDEALAADIGLLSEGTPPYSQADADSKFQKAMTEGLQVFEWRTRKKNGELFWSEVSLVRVETDTIDRMIAVVRDINERRQAEEDLRASEAKYRQLHESMRDAFVRVDMQGNIVDYNSAYEKMLGHTPEELLCLTYRDITPAKWQAMEERLIEDQVLQRGYSDVYEKEYVRKDGSVFPVELRTLLIRDRDGQPAAMWAIIRDITERKQMEDALRKSEESYRALVETISDWIWETDEQGRFTYASPAVLHILGYAPEEVVGRTFIDFMPKKEAKRVATIFTDIAADRRPYSAVESVRLHKDGRKTVLESSAVPVFSPDGDFRGYRGIDRDITEVKQARDELLKAQKLESLGILAGGIAHDFNNLLTAIVGNISLAEFQQDKPQIVTNLLKEAGEAALQAQKLTKQLITFARGGEPVKTVITLGPLLRETASFATRGSSVTCEFSLPDDLWPVKADETQLNQVFHNLAINAVQSMIPEGGTLTIRAQNSLSERVTKRYVEITVTDTGTGIPEKHLQKIFDPYFTTKKHGSGLGLATCHSIITRHGGTMKVASSPGIGTTFTVRLPAAEQAVKLDKAMLKTITRGSGRVLVMDDDRKIRMVAQAMLESLGYRVECASGGNEAIEHYRDQLEEGSPYDAVILDLTIPGGKGGKETARELLEIDPNAKMIVSSGYSAESILADYREHGFCAVLSKPYRLEDVSDVLKRVLGG